MNYRLTIIVAALILCATTAFAEDKPTRTLVKMTTNHGDIYIQLFDEEAPETVTNFVGLAEGKKEFTDAKTRSKVKRPYYDGLVFHRVIKGFMIQGGCPLGSGSGDPGYKFKDEINAKSLGLDKQKAMKGGQPHPWLLVRSQADFQRVIMQPLFKSMGIDSQEKLDAKRDEFQKKMASLTLEQAYSNQGYKYNDKLKSHHPKRGVIAMANAGPNTNGSQFFINLVDTPHLTGKHTVFGRVVKGMEIVDKIGKVTVAGGSKPVEAVTITRVRVTDEKIEIPHEPKADEKKQGADASDTDTGIKLDVPKTWKQSKVTSRFRVAQYTIPAAGDDTDDAELVVYHFGSGGGGGVDANLKRWISQFHSDGRTSRTTTGNSKQGKYWVADVTGTYNKPIGPPINRQSKATPGQRMIAVIVNTSNGLYFLKMTGPDATVAAQAVTLRTSFGGKTEGEQEYTLK